MYFENLPTIEFNNKKGTNVLKKLSLELDQKDLFYTYRIKENESPDLVAYNYYGDDKLHWLVILANKITDPLYDWLLTYEQVYQLANDKYPSNINSDHHYIDSQGNIFYDINDPTIVGSTFTVSNIQYEIDENDKKREIKLIRAEFIDDFVSELRNVT